MKIIFKRKIPENIDKPFGIYQYDELMAQNPYYIDIRGFVREKTWIWLEEIQSSFADVSRAFLRYTRWWWVTSAMSRLDARPWGQEYILKPLFFAKAIIEWIKANPNVNTIFLIGCDPLVAVYLKEFDDTLVLEENRKFFLSKFFIFQACKQSLWAILRMLRIAYFIVRYHVFKANSNVDFKIIVLNESVSWNSLTLGHKYFYGSLFDSMNSAEANTIGFVCTSFQSSNLAEFRTEFSKDKLFFFLLDNINLGDLIISMLINIYIILITWFIAFRRISCSIEKSLSNLFWPNYLFHELGRAPCLNSICCYKALKTIFRQSECKQVIYPYEEKGLERAILFACQEHNIESIGYTPHPQHRLSLSLRNTFRPMSPKPSSYAVCGSAYVDYFVSWGKKDHDSIKVWGSGKHRKNRLVVRELNRSFLKVLLLISHPNELKVFYSWLLVEKRISNNISYLIRAHKVADYKKFDKVLIPLIREFDFIKESQSSLIEDLSQCDLAVFCATSAGPVAVNHGYLAIYVDLNDFFEINPCFDDLDVMLACKSPAEFANRLDEICSMNADSIMELHHEQLSFVERIFSPIQTSTMKEDLLC